MITFYKIFYLKFLLFMITLQRINFNIARTRKCDEKTIS